MLNISENNIITVELAKVLSKVCMCLAAAILPTGWPSVNSTYKTIHSSPPHMTPKKGFLKMEKKFHESNIML